MVTSSDPLTGKWRRFRTHLLELWSAVNQVGETKTIDATSDGLNDLYELWEFWRKAAGHTNAKIDALVSGDPDGETIAALAWARGEKLHALIEFGRFEPDMFAEYFYSHYGAWVWQWHDVDKPTFPKRAEWYASRVARREVWATFAAAVRWLERQPELLLAESA